MKTLLIENSEKSKNSYFLNVLQPKDALQSNPDNDISVQPIKGDSCIGVEITSKDHIETFIFSNENKVAYQDIQSESKWISILKDKAGNVIKTTRYDGVC